MTRVITQVDGLILETDVLEEAYDDYVPKRVISENTIERMIEKPQNSSTESLIHK